MSVFRRVRTGQKSAIYDYKFVLGGKTYRGTTGQIARDAAEQFERKERDRIRRIAFGLDDDLPRHGMYFQEWAETFYEVKARTLKRPDALEWHIRAILRFFGRTPAPTSKIPIRADAPYHDLRLTDVTRDEHWIERFESEFLYRFAKSPHTRKHWRQTVRQMFELAASKKFRSKTGVTSNPMSDMPHEPTAPRTATVSPEALRAILDQASYHVRLAIAIGILAPKLRKASILALRWDQHVDADLRVITVRNHKTHHATGRPQVYPIPEQLRAILRDAKNRTRSKFVITYRGKPVKKIDGGLSEAIKSAGFHYGTTHPDGITFHTLRHSAASMMAVLGVSPMIQRDMMGHASVDMTAWYTHADEPHLRDVAEQLSQAYTIADIVTNKRRRAVRANGAQNGHHTAPDGVKLPSTNRDAIGHETSTKQP